MDAKIAKLQIDAALGENKREIFENHIKPFIDTRTAILFDAFVNTEAGDIETLQKIKMQQTVLASLEAYFREYIDTGKLAKHELERINHDDQ